MTSIKASIRTELYRIELKSPTGNIVIADEPIDKGGQDKGFNPKELLAASLAACTCATVRMYADRKAWPLENVYADVELLEEDGQTKFIRKIQFTGDLDEEQRARLLVVANACPLHKILTHSIVIETTVV
ncbi:OsmC family protein [Mucilaginibacter auburnensis]|uniref:Putative redox protein n=1 Tax=Mucilaginibacter auburnensis TaxID=1457233 RepID=A0A2H9VP50_9SPHI|nr:OsmC family protein [Mucilaginibacter auburnensis]PJJ80105.1 putative redox protein [Mucilaginibacter auburnensis]